MTKTATGMLLVCAVALLATAGVASASGEFGLQPGAMPSFGVKMCHSEPLPIYAESLAQILADTAGGRIAVVDTYNIAGRSGFPATDWYNLGYRAILAFTDATPMDPAAVGDSLAKFVQLGGGVVEGAFSDCSPYEVTGSWRFLYAPFAVLSQSNTSGFLATVNQPLHPIMTGVSAIDVGSYRTRNTVSTLRSPNCVSLAEYGDSSRCLVAYFDSAGRRAVSLGMFPLTRWLGAITGQWVRLIVNALDWVAVGPSVGVTVPNGGESWAGNTVHSITWTQTANGVRDSIYYSTDAGSSWTGAAYFASPPAPLEYAWTVPNTPTAQARVKVVTWNSDGGRVEDVSDAGFTITAAGIAQPGKDTLPLAFGLLPSSPNPLAVGTALRYALPRQAQVELRIYDVAGTLVRRLASGVQPAGNRSAYWDGRDDSGRSVASGVYYCRLRAADFLSAQKLVVRR